jgi:acyl-CoA thioesterase FadM
MPAAHHAGFHGIVHGGIISTALDEAMFWAAASAKKRFCLAAELNVRFLKKVAVSEKYLFVSKFDADRGRIWHSSAELRDAAGKVCARATCKQVPLDVAAMKHAALDFLPDPATTRTVALPDLVAESFSVNNGRSNYCIERRSIEQAVRD